MTASRRASLDGSRKILFCSASAIGRRLLGARRSRASGEGRARCRPRAAGSALRSARARGRGPSEQVVRRRRGERVVAVPRGVRADAVALVRDDLGLVERDPDARRRRRAPRRRSAAYSAKRSAVSRVGPAARVLERLRQVPVVERDRGRDVARAQPVDERAVEVDAALVDGARDRRLDARPGDREAERVQTERCEQVEVVLAAVVEVARDVAGVAAAAPSPACG